MQDIYAFNMEFEQCYQNKEHIDIIVPYSVIHYVVSGEGYVNGQRVCPGYAFLAITDSHISYFPCMENPWSYVYVRLHGNDVKKAFEEAGCKSVIFPFEKTSELLNLLPLYEALNAINNKEAQKLIANILIMLHNDNKTTDKACKSARKRNADKIKRYIDDNYFKKITVLDIASELYLSPNYLRNLFSEYMEISPKKYIQNKRMERAKDLLRETDMSITLIAHSVGYEDSLLFSKMFSRYFNISPKKYREKTDSEG